MLRKLLRICWIAAAWALAWGVMGAAIGGAVTVFRPDTGHIPTKMVPVLVGVPSAAFGLGAGLLYGTLAIALGFETRLGKTGRAILGGGICCAAGLVFMIVLAHSYLVLFVAVLLGVALVTVFSHRNGPQTGDRP